MSSFEIKPAERSGARLLIQLSGVSGSGKTYSALQLAFGLAGYDANKVVGIDTENRRMSLNADILPNGARFRTLDFFAPFSPDRYIEAIEAAIKGGAEVIVIDSVSHEWESEGGCEWIASQTKFPDWKKAKALHKRFMTYMLQAPAHIIACTRAREKVDFSDPKNPRPLGIQPIQEKNFSFEATVSLMMHNQGYLQDVLKCPADLQAVMGRGKGYITAEDGKALRDWVDGAKAVNPEVERYRGNLLNVTEQGLDALRDAWGATPANIRAALGKGFIDQCKSAAESFERIRAEAGNSQPDASIAALNEAATQAVQPPANTTGVESAPEVTVEAPAQDDDVIF